MLFWQQQVGVTLKLRFRQANVTLVLTKLVNVLTAAAGLRSDASKWGKCQSTHTRTHTHLLVVCKSPDKTKGDMLRGEDDKTCCEETCLPGQEVEQLRCAMDYLRLSWKQSKPYWMKWRSISTDPEISLWQTTFLPRLLLKPLLFPHLFLCLPSYWNGNGNGT